MVECHDLPFGDAANLPLFLICRELNGDPKVILQGDGGDELFAGYFRYSRLQRIRWFQAIAPLALPLSRIIPKNTKAYRSLRTVNALANSPEDEQMAWLMSQEPFGAKPETILGTSIRDQVVSTDPFARYRQMYQTYATPDKVRQMQLTDCSIILPDKYFEKVDRATMAHSIEVRVPFMDLELSHFALGLPSKYKVYRGEKKRILRDVLRGVVPDTILDGKKKGFGVPMSEWLRGPLAGYMKSILFDKSIIGLGLLDNAIVQKRVDAHINREADFGMLLYKLLVLSIWLKKYNPSLT